MQKMHVCRQEVTGNPTCRVLLMRWNGKNERFTWKDSSLLQHSAVHTSALSGYKMQLGCSMDQGPSLGDLERNKMQ